LPLPQRVERLVAIDSADWRLPDRIPEDVAAALPNAVRELEHALGHDDPQALAAIICDLLTLYPEPNRTLEHRALVAEHWLEDLAEYPLAVVAEAARHWRRSQQWAPRICELRALCDGLLARRRRELLRARFLLACVERHGGQVPVLARCIGERLVDYGDRATDRDLELWLRGENDAGGHRVWALPRGPAETPPEQPAAHAGASAETPTPQPRISARQRVLRTLVAAGVSVREIEAGYLLDILDEPSARQYGERWRQALAGAMRP
jgi:hypothetical protein